MKIENGERNKSNFLAIQKNAQFEGSALTAKYRLQVSECSALNLRPDSGQLHTWILPMSYLYANSGSTIGSHHESFKKLKTVFNSIIIIFPSYAVKEFYSLEQCSLSIPAAQNVTSSENGGLDGLICKGSFITRNSFMFRLFFPRYWSFEQLLSVKVRVKNMNYTAV